MSVDDCSAKNLLIKNYLDLKFFLLPTDIVLVISVGDALVPTAWTIKFYSSHAL